MFTDCPSSDPEAKDIELRTVKDLPLAERCPAVKIMSLDEACKEFRDDRCMTGPRMDSASIVEVEWFL